MCWQRLQSSSSFFGTPQASSNFFQAIVRFCCSVSVNILLKFSIIPSATSYKNKGIFQINEWTLKLLEWLHSRRSNLSLYARDLLEHRMRSSRSLGSIHHPNPTPNKINMEPGDLNIHRWKHMSATTNDSRFHVNLPVNVKQI